MTTAKPVKAPLSQEPQEPDILDMRSFLVQIFDDFRKSQLQGRLSKEWRRVEQSRQILVGFVGRLTDQINKLTSLISAKEGQTSYLKNDFAKLCQDFDGFVKGSRPLVDQEEEIFRLVGERENMMKKKIVTLMMHLDERIIELKKSLGNSQAEKSKILALFAGGENSPERAKAILGKVLKFKEALNYKELAIEALKAKLGRKKAQFLEFELRAIERESKLARICETLEKAAEVKTDSGPRSQEDLNNSLPAQKPKPRANQGRQPFEDEPALDDKKSLFNSLEAQMPSESKPGQFPRPSNILKNFNAFLAAKEAEIAEKQAEIKSAQERQVALNNSIVEANLELKLLQRGQPASSGGQQDSLASRKEQIRSGQVHIKQLEQDIAHLKVRVGKVQVQIVKAYKENARRLRAMGHLARSVLGQLEPISRAQRVFVKKLATRISGGNFQEAAHRKLPALIFQYNDLRLIEFFVAKKYGELLKSPALKELERLAGEREAARQDEGKSKEQLQLEGMQADREKIKELSRKNAQFMDEIQRMAAQREESMAKVGQIISGLQKMNGELKANLAESGRLQEENRSHKLRIVELESAGRASQDQLQALQADYQRALKEGTESAERLRQQEKKIAEVQAKARKLEDEKKELKVALRQNEAKLEEKRKEIEALTLRLEEITKKNGEMKLAMEEQYRKIQEICEENYARSAMIDDLAKKEKIFDQIYAHQKEKITLKETKILQMSRKIEDLERLLESLSKKSGSSIVSKRSSSKGDSEVKEREKEAKERESRLQVLGAKTREYEGMIDDLRAKIEQKTQDVRRESEKSKKLAERLRHYEKVERAQFEERIYSLLRRLLQYDSSLQELKEKAEKLQKDSGSSRSNAEKDYEAKLEQLGAGLNQMKQEFFNGAEFLESGSESSGGQRARPKDQLEQSTQPLGDQLKQLVSEMQHSKKPIRGP